MAESSQSTNPENKTLSKPLLQEHEDDKTCSAENPNIDEMQSLGLPTSFVSKGFKTNAPCTSTKTRSVFRI